MVIHHTSILGSSVFIMAKTTKVGEIKIQITKGIRMNYPKFTSAKIRGKVKFCDGNNVRDLLQSLNNKHPSEKNENVLVIDLGVTKCNELLSKSELYNAGLAGLVILETEELNHECINYDLTQIKSYPAISILQKDVQNFL